jgi:hypothetical protein
MLCAVCAGCWTAPVAPGQAPPSGTCRVRDTDVDAIAPLRLELHGERFAVIEPPFMHLDVTVAGAIAHARVETDAYVLEGDVPFDTFPLRPRGDALHDGWVQIDSAHGLAAIGDSLRIGVQLPAGLRPRMVAFVVPCRELTFAKAGDHAAPDDAEYLELVPNTTTKLLRAPGGEILAILVAPPPHPPGDDAPSDVPISVRVLERRGAMLHVRIEDPNAVEGWIAASATRIPEDGDVYGGLMGSIGDSAGVVQTCDHAVPIYVRSGDRFTRVGKLKAGAPLNRKGPRVGGEVMIDLGDTEIPAFVHVSDLAGCRIDM